MKSHDTRPPIDMTVSRGICDRHGEPFRSQWPAGYPLFMVKAFQSVVSADEFHAELRDKFGDQADAYSSIEALLDIRPLCCRLSSRTLLKLYEESLPDTRRRCVNCRRKRLGAPFKVMTRNGPHEYSHVCFYCVVYNMEPCYGPN